jgi:hypothetical protein
MTAICRWRDSRRISRGRRHRPRVERLEGRRLLATFTVTDTSDSPTETGSLRYAESVSGTHLGQDSRVVAVGPRGFDVLPR